MIEIAPPALLPALLPAQPWGTKGTMVPSHQLQNIE